MKFSLPFFKTAKPSAIQNLQAEAVYALHQQHAPGVVFLDVRQPMEWKEGTIPGSKKVSLDQLGAQLGKLDKSLTYVLVCRSGNRSQMAARQMEKAGFARLSNFQGGMLAWNRLGYPVTR